MWRPMLQFLLIGAVLFGVDQVRESAAAARAPRGRIVLDEATLDRLGRDALSQTGRLPDAGGLRRLAEQWVDDEVLYREALRIGLDRGDPVVRNRLVRNMRFLVGADDPRSDAELFAEALEVGMDRSDIVVRRRLVQQMRFLLEARAGHVEPDDEALRDFIAAHPERYRIPERVRLTHVYLSRDRRGAALADDARALLEQLRRRGIPPEEAAKLGDPFLHPAQLGLQSKGQLARQLGAQFARAAMAVAAGQWQGPIASAYGMHLVWLHEREAAHDPDLDTVRRAVASAMQSEREARVLARELASLRKHYVVDRSALASGDAS